MPTTNSEPSVIEANASGAAQDAAVHDVPSPEVIEGLVRERQIVAVGGTYGLGKSPWLQELLVCRVHGLPWCGRQVQKGPAVLIDFENAAATIRRNIANACTRYGVPFPTLPDELEIFPEIDDPSKNPATARLLDALVAPPDARIKLIAEIVTRKPNALIVIDPPEMFFRLDTGKKTQVLRLYTQYRLLLSHSSGAVIINTFNLRKRDRSSRSQPADLLSDPRGWLEEICGSLDLLNRSDCRLGMAFHGSDGDGLRVVNGIRRGEEVHPLLIRGVALDDDPDQPAGFELVQADATDLVLALPAKLFEYWRALPQEFSFAQAIATMGKSNFDRLKKRTISLGVLELLERGSYRKQTGTGR
jgi:hypothetical protein